MAVYSGFYPAFGNLNSNLTNDCDFDSNTNLTISCGGGGEDESAAETEIPEDSGCHVLNLYPEILTHIFQYLEIPERGRAAQVCRYWRDVVYDKAVWRGVEAKMHLETSGNTMVYTSLARRGIFQVQILSLKRSLRALVAGLPGIVSLKLSGCYSVTDSTLASAFSMTALPGGGGMAAQLTQLTTLDLSLCKQMSDVSLARIANRAPNLKNLELGGCCQISDCGLLIIAWGLKKLERLNLRSCYLITDMGIGFLSGIVTPSHLQTPRIHSFLKSLGILEQTPGGDTPAPNSNSNPSNANAAAAAVLAVASPEGKHHQQQQRSKPSLQIVGPAVETFPKKQRLDNHLIFVQAPNNGSQQRCVICQQVGFPIQQQHFGSMDNSASVLWTDSNSNSNSRVKLHGKRSRGNGSTTNGSSYSNVNTTTSGSTNSTHTSSRSRHHRSSAYYEEYFLEKISPGTTAFGTKELQFLGLQDCQKLSDECLTFIGQGGLPKLQSVNLSFCIHISDNGLKELAKLSSISEVNLRSCDNVSDLGLLNLSDCGGRLRCLDVSFCDKVGNSGLGYIAQYMPRLKTLSLSACDISDQGLMRVASVLTSLETLNLGQCSKITDEALKIIAEKCTQIKYIDLYGCTQISKEGLNLILNMSSIKSLNLGLWHWR